VHWIGLAQDMGRWRALVNEFHKMLGNYQVTVQLMVSRVVLSQVIYTTNEKQLYL
jgi:hypothetical protein